MSLLRSGLVHGRSVSKGQQIQQKSKTRNTQNTRNKGYKHEDERQAVNGQGKVIRVGEDDHGGCFLVVADIICNHESISILLGGTETHKVEL